MPAAFPAPTFKTGFARHAGEARFPHLWRECILAYSPGLGPTGSMIHDWSGKWNRGTLTNFTLASAWSADAGRYRVLHDGTNDYIPLPSTLMAGLKQWHVSMFLWNVSISGLGSPFGDSLATFSSHPTLRFASSKYSILAGNGSTFFVNASTAANAKTGTTEHVSFGYNGYDVLVYRDGVLTDTLSATDNQTLSSAASDMRIGGGSSGSATPYSGAWDDLVVHSRCLTASEVRALASRRGIMHELNPAVYARRRFNPAWASRSNVLLTPGIML